MKSIFLFVILISNTLFAQITITSSDVSNVFTVGNSVIINSMDITSFDIGSAGGGNNWDFTGLQSTETYDLMCVDPVSTPYTNEFPGANIGTYASENYQGNPAEIWSYLNVNGTFSNMGQAITSNAYPGLLITSKNNPAATELQLPMTYNTSWSQSYVNTVAISGFPPTQTDISIDVVVDAWGTMTMPGGSSFDALRIRESTTENGDTYVAYSFLSKTGANVTVEASDPNPPNSGVISAVYYDWNLPFTTDVEQISGLPSDFSLSQNYPNPFNPTTKIEYSIPEESFVQLRVFDILGNEVVTVVNQEQNAGTYRADFDAENLASGFYIARLQAGNYTKSIKMALLR